MFFTNFAYFTGTYDWLIVGAVVLLLFGGAKLPQLAKGLGEGIREFKKSVNPNDPDPTDTTVSTVTTTPVVTTAPVTTVVREVEAK